MYCQPVPTWSKVHTITFTTENISFQESRTGDSLTVHPIVVHSEIANASDEFSQDDHFEFGIDDLKDQLGIDHIMQSLSVLNEKLVSLGSVACFSSRIRKYSCQIGYSRFCFFLMTFSLTQRQLFRPSKVRHPHREPTVQNSSTQACFYPQCLRRRRASVLMWLMLLLSD